MTNPLRTLLVGDVGGTNVRFALARETADGLDVGRISKRKVREFPDFMAALSSYLQGVDVKLDGAAIGLAGPVGDGPVTLLNAGWTCDPEEIARRLGGAPTLLINDFVAMARAAPLVEPQGRPVVLPGEAEAGENVVVGGPGTGFGLATLHPTGAGGWVIVGGEGGHQAFAPATETEWRLAERLRSQGVYVSNEIVAAGAGFRMTLDALADVLGLPRQPVGPEEVTALAEAGDPLADAYFRLRAATTLSALGDAALAANAFGGVFVAGGVGVRLRKWLQAPETAARFRERGPRTELLSNVPVWLLDDDEAPLRGAAALWRDREARGWL
jgi:glucokinase